MTYAIIEIGGKLNAFPGETLSLNKVLLLNKDGKIILGHPCIDDFTVKAKVLRHFKGKKTIVFKMKRKKNMRSKRGCRQELTRLLIQEI